MYNLLFIFSVCIYIYIYGPAAIDALRVHVCAYLNASECPCAPLLAQAKPCNSYETPVYFYSSFRLEERSSAFGVLY